MNISKYITLSEAIKSDTAIRRNIVNIPNSDQIESMQHVAINIFDKVREKIGGPLGATSFFRSQELNTFIGGSSKTSQHMLGEAIDIDCDKFGIGTNKGVFDYIREHLEFDQLIWEYGDSFNPDWVHVSLKKNGHNRKEVLRKTIDRYLPFDLY